MIMALSYVVYGSKGTFEGLKQIMLISLVYEFLDYLLASMPLVS